MTFTKAPETNFDGVNGWSSKSQALRAAKRLVRRHKFLAVRPLMIAAELHAWRAGVRERWHIHMVIGRTCATERQDLREVEYVSRDARGMWGISHTSWQPGLANELALRYAAKYVGKDGSVLVRLGRGCGLAL